MWRSIRWTFHIILVFFRSRLQILTKIIQISAPSVRPSTHRTLLRNFPTNLYDSFTDTFHIKKVTLTDTIFKSNNKVAIEHRHTQMVTKLNEPIFVYKPSRRTRVFQNDIRDQTAVKKATQQMHTHVHALSTWKQLSDQRQNCYKYFATTTTTWIHFHSFCVVRMLTTTTTMKCYEE